MFFTSNMLPSLKSRHGVQKRGPPTPKMGSKKFANPSVFFFDDLKNIVHKIFFAKHFHWWNIQYLPNGPDLGTHPGVSPLIRIIFWIKGLALLILYSTGLGLSKTVFILKMSFFFLFQNLGSNFRPEMATNSLAYGTHKNKTQENAKFDKLNVWCLGTYQRNTETRNWQKRKKFNHLFKSLYFLVFIRCLCVNI
jgi:hypothetical protein